VISKYHLIPARNTAMAKGVSVACAVWKRTTVRERHLKNKRNARRGKRKNEEKAREEEEEMGGGGREGGGGEKD
jgi:hypothetical protein